MPDILALATGHDLGRGIINERGKMAEPRPRKGTDIVTRLISTSGLRAAAALLASLGLLVALTAPALGAEKWTICHATSSEGNPFVAITVDAGAALDPHLTPDQNPVAGHEDDFLLEFEGDADDCEAAANPTPTPTPTPTPEVTPTPTPTGGELGGTPTPTPTPGGQVLGGNPTPTPAPVPNTAMAVQTSVAAIGLAVMLIGSLLAMALVRVARQPR